MLRSLLQGRALALALLVLVCLVALLLPTPAQAATDAVDLGAAPLLAAWYEGVLGNKHRMIQVATLALIVGILFLCWGKK